ncbi:hypothetical protein HanRHA438_Chr13g0582781 [Helianthus annuus]|nr:hypothetical protein HanRHA438_Chr13g0582781 [Helianthus annuus]
MFLHVSPSVHSKLEEHATQSQFSNSHRIVVTYKTLVVTNRIFLKKLSVTENDVSTTTFNGRETTFTFLLLQSEPADVQMCILQRRICLRIQIWHIFRRKLQKPKSTSGDGGGK